MNATTVVALISTAVLTAAATSAVCAPSAARLRRAERELADARAHLDWWRLSAVNFAARNRTLRRQVASVNAHNIVRGW